MDAARRYGNLGHDVVVQLEGFTTTGCRVPLDIVELIMDQLPPVGSLLALRQCSLVCKDFAAICQKHIFTDIALSNGGKYLRGSRKQPFAALASFKKALVNKPHLEGYVRALNYCHEFDLHGQWPPVLRRLQHVQSLRIRFLTQKLISWSSSEILPSFKSSFLRFLHSNQITHLYLCLIRDLPTRIFALVPCLEALETRMVTLNNNPPFVQENPPKLRALHLHRGADQPVHTLIASQNGIIDLRSLEHINIDMGGIPTLMGEIRSLLRQSEVLDSLKIQGSLPDLDFHDSFARSLPDKCLQSLKTFEPIIELHKAEDDPYLNLTSELEKLSGRNVLENLTILITVPIWTTCNTETPRWSELDRVLSRPSAFPCLRCVQVTVDVTYFHESDRNKEMEKEVAIICDDAFPWLKENNLFKFVITLEISQLD